MKNLVVARCGPNSLHKNWIKGDVPNFDLVITYYGDEIPSEWKSDDYPIHKIKGSKWAGLYKYLTENDGWRTYKNIFLPDDDLLFDAKILNEFFGIFNDLDLDLAQPALDPQSYFTHVITLRSESFDFRVTNFAEIMCPCLSSRFLDKTLELFSISDSGYGMDNYWATLLDQNGYKPPVIVDRTPIMHTRPVGSAGNGGANSPMHDLQKFIKMKKFKLEKNINFAGKLVGGNYISVSGDIDNFQLALLRDLATKVKKDFVKIAEEMVFVVDSYPKIFSK